DYLFFDDETAEHGVRKNSDSIKIIKNAYIEPCAKNAALEDRFQFIRNGYYSLDSKLTTDEKLVFNQTVGLKSSYK
ncbi:MAG: glutamine--tRNA ligase, partial [Defluviitaleaceae bacterium]|nr:glutamine--tRNA ligase [Defluviitaleaceae bacterium]